MAKSEKHRHTIEVKVRFSPSELALAKLAEEKFEICRAETLRELYMSKICTLIASDAKEDKSSAA